MSQKVECSPSITATVPNGVVKEWLVWGAKPPTTTNQKDFSVAVEVEGEPCEAEEVEDKVVPGRKLLVARIISVSETQKKSVTVTFHYAATLLESRLVPGPPAEPVAPLSPQERQVALMPTPSLDYNDPSFQSWLKENKIAWDKQQSEISFAYDVLKLIRDRADYGVVERDNTRRKVSVYCRESVFDCGPSSALFVGIMRANGIPAHKRDGWMSNGWVKKDGKELSHVRAEFYAEGIGWIPVEVAGILSADDETIRRRLMEDAGDLIGLYMDGDFELEIDDYKPQTSMFLQQPGRSFRLSTGQSAGHTRTDKVTIRALGVPEKPRDGIEMIEDFEDGYGNWKTEGPAFGAVPANGALPKQQPVTGYSGRSLVNTFLGGDAAQGTALSRPFEITKPYIRFLIGGGQDPERLALQLIVGQRVVRWSTGHNDERLREGGWDVSSYRGMTAQLRIIDLSSQGWGHINVDGIAFADTPPR